MTDSTSITKDPAALWVYCTLLELLPAGRANGLPPRHVSVSYSELAERCPLKWSTKAIRRAIAQLCAWGTVQVTVQGKGGVTDGCNANTYHVGVCDHLLELLGKGAVTVQGTVEGRVDLHPEERVVDNILSTTTLSSGLGRVVEECAERVKFLCSGHLPATLSPGEVMRIVDQLGGEWALRSIQGAADRSRRRHKPVRCRRENLVDMVVRYGQQLRERKPHERAPDPEPAARAQRKQQLYSAKRQEAHQARMAEIRRKSREHHEDLARRGVRIQW